MEIIKFEKKTSFEEHLMNLKQSDNNHLDDIYIDLLIEENEYEKKERQKKNLSIKECYAFIESSQEKATHVIIKNKNKKERVLIQSINTNDYVLSLKKSSNNIHWKWI